MDDVGFLWREGSWGGDSFGRQGIRSNGGNTIFFGGDGSKCEAICDCLGNKWFKVEMDVVVWVMEGGGWCWTEVWPCPVMRLGSGLGFYFPGRVFASGFGRRMSSWVIGEGGFLEMRFACKKFCFLKMGGLFFVVVLLVLWEVLGEKEFLLEERVFEALENFVLWRRWKFYFRLLMDIWSFFSCIILVRCHN